MLEQSLHLLLEGEHIWLEQTILSFSFFGKHSRLSTKGSKQANQEHLRTQPG